MLYIYTRTHVHSTFLKFLKCNLLTELLYFFIFFSKINRDNLNDSISAILQASQDKPRKFTQSVELQIVLKNYDPQKDRRFAGTVRYLYMLK